MRTILAFILVLFTMFSIIGYGAEEASQHLQRGIQLLDELFIDKAISELETTINLGLSSDEEEIQCYFHLAKAYITNNENNKAIKSFLSLLRIRKDFQLTDVSPKITAILEEAKSQADLTPPKIQHKPPKSAKVGDKLRFQAQATDDRKVASVTLTFQMPNSKSETVQMNYSDKRFIYESPKLTVPGALKYSIVAMDEWGNESMPVSSSVEVVAKKSRRLWKWPGLGALSVIAGVVTYYIIKPPSPPPLPNSNWPGKFPSPPE